MRYFKVLVIFSFFSKTYFSQNYSGCYVFSNTNAIFYGIDYSKVRFVNINNPEFGDLEKVKNIYLNEINDVINYETNKYPLDEIFKIPIKKSFQKVKNRNNNVNINNIGTDEQKLTEKDIDEILSYYPNTETDTDLGIILIAENLVKLKLDKSDYSFTKFYLIFFRISDHSKLISLELIGEAGGIGFRNYWSNSVYKVLKSINMKKLKKEYCPK